MTSVPPATSFTRPTSPARPAWRSSSATVSSTLLGFTKSKAGRRSNSVAPVLRAARLRRRRNWLRGRRLPVLVRERLQDLRRRERQLREPDAAGVVDRVRDRRDRRMERAFPRLLRAVRPLRIERLDDARVELRAIERGRDRVVEQARPR